MSKSVMISIKPRWCELIASGKKTVEVRKTRPKLKTPFKCYIYESRGDEKAGNEDYTYVKAGNGRQKVIGEFICDAIYSVWAGYTANNGDDCLTFDERETFLGSNMGYGWHISNLKIYDEPKELSEFMQCHKCEYNSGCKEHEYSCDGTYKVTRPPQSWMYVEEIL